MSDDIKIEPMGWGWCPRCKCDMDEYNPSQLVITQRNKDYQGQVKKLLRLQCSMCDYILFENTIDVRDYQ